MKSTESLNRAVDRRLQQKHDQEEDIVTEVPETGSAL